MTTFTMPNSPPPANVMVDLETLGLVPGCAIVSIGAVWFGEVAGVGQTGLYATVSRESNKIAGLHEDEATLAWWDRQSHQARQVLFDADRALAMPLPAALLWLNSFIAKAGPDVCVWGNGVDFDNAILAAAFRACGLTPGWNFWNNRCYRTLKNLHPDIELKREGVHHNALDDARTQAEHAVRILRARTLWPSSDQVRRLNEAAVR